jgi:hypothetical protein
LKNTRIPGLQIFFVKAEDIADRNWIPIPNSLYTVVYLPPNWMHQRKQLAWIQTTPPKLTVAI